MYVYMYLNRWFLKNNSWYQFFIKAPSEESISPQRSHSAAKNRVQFGTRLYNDAIRLQEKKCKESEQAQRAREQAEIRGLLKEFALK